MKSLVLIVICSIFLGSSAYLLNYYIFLEPEPRDEAQLPQDRKILVLCLNDDGNAGAILRQDNLSWCASPAVAGGDRFLTKEANSIADLSNIALKKFAAKGAFLTRDKFLYPDEPGYLGLLLGEHTRAKSVPVSNIEDYDTVLHRGDHVDLLFAYKNPVSVRKAGEVTVKTLLKNVRVLGIKGDYGQGSPGTINGLEIKRDHLTLALSSRQAELVSVAEQTGSLSILLRSPADITSEALDFPAEEGIRETDLIGYNSISDSNDPAVILSKIRIIRGGKTTFIDRPAAREGLQHVGLK